MLSVLQQKKFFLVYSKDFFFFTWKFKESDMKHGNKIRSSNFNLVSQASFLQMEVGDYFFVKLFNPPENAKCGHFTILISDADDKIFHNERVSCKYFIKLFRSEKLYIDLLDSFSKEFPFTKNYPIIVTCAVKFGKNIDNDVSSSIDSTVWNNLQELSLDLKKALDKSSDSDIVLNVEGDSIKAHRMILKARSAVFQKMLTHEEAAKEVVISDVGSKTMKRLLSYLYSGSFEKCDFEETLELYYAADKYQVISLRNNCRTVLLSLLEVKNACILYALASRHSDKEFKKEVVQFIKAHFKPVAQTELFSKLSKDDVILLTRACV